MADISRYNLEDYEGIKIVGGLVSETLSQRKIPYPSDIERIFGPDGALAYYFMHTLFHTIENREGIYAMERRRDGKALQEHSFSAAFSDFYRFRDQLIPSYFLLGSRERKSNLLHDVPEEFGNDLLGALISISIIRGIFKEEVGSDVDYLTDKNSLVLDLLEERLKESQSLVITHEVAYGAIDRARLDSRVRYQDVKAGYRKTKDAFASFRHYVDREADYMPDSERNRLDGILARLARNVDAYARRPLKSDRIIRMIKRSFEHVMDLMEDSQRNGTYHAFDERFLMPSERNGKARNVLFMRGLKATLYRDYLRQIGSKVISSASRSYDAKNDDYLAKAVEKVAEASHSAKNIDTNSRHAINVFTKGEALVEEFSRVAADLRNMGKDSSRLEAGLRWYVKNLRHGVRVANNFHKGRSEVESAQGHDSQIFGIMVEKISDLEARLDHSR